MTAVDPTVPLGATGSAGEATAEPGWPLALRIARRELRTGLRGFGIFLACLALGVAIIAGVGSLSRALFTGLEQDGRAILGGDLDLRLIHREITPDQRAWLEARGTISEVAHLRAMAQAPAAAEGGPDRKVVLLRAVDDLFPLYGAVRTEGGEDLQQALARRDGAWGAVTDRALLDRFGLEQGDTIRIGAVDYRVRGVLERMPDQASIGLTLGSPFLVAWDSLEDTGLILPGSLVRYYYRLALPPGGDPTAVVSALEEAFPEAGWRVRTPGEATPRLTRLLGQLTSFLTLIGLSALVVGGIGVGNAVRTFLDTKTATIATLKCLGAPSRLVLRVYLLQILAIALVGIALGLLVGALVPFAVDALLGDSLGWRAVARLYPLPLVTAALFGLLTTLAFALWPLARAKSVPAAALFRDRLEPGGLLPDRTTLLAISATVLTLAGLAVLDAHDRRLALIFVGGTAGALLLFRLTGSAIVALARRVPRPRRTTLRLAVANLHRPGAPTPAVVTSLGLGLTLLVAIALVQGNLGRSFDEAVRAEAPDIFFLDVQPDQIGRLDALAEGTRGVEAYERVPMLRGRITAVNGQKPSELGEPAAGSWIFRGDRGLTWSSEPPKGAEITAGAWWPPDYQGPPLVSFDAENAAEIGLSLGDRLTVNVLGRDVEVEIANLRTVDWQSLTINFVMIFSPGLLEAAPWTWLATLRAEPEAARAVERAALDDFPNVSAIRVAEALAAFTELVGRIALALNLAAAVAVVAGILVLAGAIAAGHRRRVYDAVVLKVLGATRGTIARAFLVEYGLIGLVTAAIALVIGSLTALVLVTWVLELPFVPLPGVALATAAVALAVTLAAGLAGTWRALSHKAAPLLRNE